MTTNATVETRRGLYLQALYALDGREDPSHPRHNTYSGLYESRIQQMVEQDMLQLLGAASDS